MAADVVEIVATSRGLVAHIDGSWSDWCMLDGHTVLSIVLQELWKTRTPPTPLNLGQLIPGDLTAAVGSAAESPTASASKALNLKDQALWCLEDHARVFVASIVKYLTQREAELGSAVFDKDDELAVDFVTAASNLRAACYNIPQQSLFDAKGMAGNIIHAIATTNAIVGGIIVVEALKLLAGTSTTG